MQVLNRVDRTDRTLTECRIYKCGQDHQTISTDTLSLVLNTFPLS
jgi:hypothetical protein